jgi:hypothetical protein
MPVRSSISKAVMVPSRLTVGVDVDLDAEGAADILADHAHLLLLQAEMQGGDVLHHMRCLRALVNCQTDFGRIPVGDD